jgi:phosphoribosylaminoimidazole-succinocarboxamide synthase
MADGDLWGVAVPPGLRECDKLPAPVFTPSTKATSGHDAPMRPDEVAERIGPEMAARVAQASLALYEAAAEHASERGILIADTKFEWGTVPGGADGGDFSLILIDEALTPDSSRFWDAATMCRGSPSLRSTNSSCATSCSAFPAGTGSRPRRTCRPRSSPGPRTNTAKPTGASPAAICRGRDAAAAARSAGFSRRTEAPQDPTL